MRPGNRYLGSALDSDAKPTLGDLAQRRQRVTATCVQCHHVAHLEPSPLIAKLGYDFMVEKLPTKFRCSTCGSQRVDITLSRD